ncbi:hypothetical protein R1flu_011678 [Riccia fluitans]|uniref:Phytocyanin domain-containing protein n=1 Tax=Riccia fluitans TaxID=41844 RepID=A0ABD1Z8G9_9MARC
MDHSRSQRNSKFSASALLTLLCVALLADGALAATTVNVGGSSGWTLGYNYRTWASTTRVKPWDALFFKYDPRLHNVLLVSKADFDACRTTAPWPNIHLERTTSSSPSQEPTTSSVVLPGIVLLA